MQQVYRPSNDTKHSFTRSTLHCPYQFTCQCYVALAVKYYKDRVTLLQSGEHTLDSHAQSKGILTPKQRGAVVRAVRAAPMAVGAQVLSNLQNSSPGKHVPFDQRSRAAVNRLVRRTRGDIMSARVPGIKLDGSEGSMNQLAESLSLVKFLERHNDPADPFHMSAHQVVSVGHQFSNGVSFLCATTPYLLGNMARAVNCGCQKQGHTDAAFNWCGKEIALVGFGMNRMGAHFNPVSLSIVNAESKQGIMHSYKATCAGLYTLYNTASLCDSPECEFCTQIEAQVGKHGALWRKQLESDDAANLHYQLDNPSSDHCASYHVVAKERFGPDVNVGQCGQHISGQSF